MQGFFYIALIRSKERKPVLELRDLCISKTYIQVDFLDVLEQEGIKIEEIQPSQSIFDLQIQLEESKYPFVYYFVQSDNLLLVAVTDTHSEKINGILEQLVLDLENNLEFSTAQTILNPKQQELTQNIFAQNFAPYLVPSFLVPEKIEQIELPDATILENYGISEDFFKKIDGTWSIADFAEQLNREITPTREIFYKLWVAGLIYFRSKYNPWDLFIQTARAPLYLDDGSEENLTLINKFNSNKIIRLIQLVESEQSYQKIYQNMDITNTKLQKYITTLINEQIIRKKPIILNIQHPTEDLIPVLSLQGFNKTDFEILSKLEESLDGQKDLDEIALEVHVEPSKIKILLDKYGLALQLMD